MLHVVDGTFPERLYWKGYYQTKTQTTCTIHTLVRIILLRNAIY